MYTALPGIGRKEERTILGKFHRENIPNCKIFWTVSSALQDPEVSL